MYQATYNLDALHLGAGNRIIITGWTPPESLVKKLSPEDYAVIGPLYNGWYGLNALFANLLANPEYRRLSLLFATRQDQNSPAVQALYSFKESGYQEDPLDPTRWLIKKESKILGKINRVFPAKILDKLREELELSLFTNQEDLITNLKQEEHKAHLERSFKSDPIYIEIPVTESKTIPALTVAQTIQAPTIAEAWVKILDRIRKHGLVEGNRQELINFTSVITEEPAELFIPDWLPVTRNQVEAYLPDLNSITPTAPIAILFQL